mgnify:CR=1 FL=1
MSTSPSQKNVVETNQPNNESQTTFGAKNFLLMAVGVALIIVGYVLMVGGSSDANPEVFNAEEKYSFVRITLSPLLILAGLAIQIPAILLRAKQ